MIPPIHRILEPLRVNCTVAGPNCGCNRNCCSESPGGACCAMLGIAVDVCHLNEGHAAFAVLERAREYMEETGRPFHEALTITRAGNIFTTHTAVDAGFDRFSPQLIQQYLSAYAQNALGISVDDLLVLGRKNPSDVSEYFNMAYLAIHGSGSVNGVSRLHGHVSRRLFQQLFPRFPQNEVPVGHVTNGIHVPTWDGADADRLWTELCGKERWRGDLDSLGPAIRRADDQQIWNVRSSGRAALVEYARQRLSRQQAGYGASLLQVQQAEAVLNPQTLTLGFARRFATYKQPTLLLHDRERLARILTNPQRPVQLVLAGKAHPADQPGQALIREWASFARQPEIRPHVVFLSDYDMTLGQRLVEGVDVWINTPEAPLGSQRHQRDESAGKWWPEPINIGRMVGGSLHSRSGMGDRRREGTRR